VTAEPGRCYATAAAVWDADAGPPRAELLTRAERSVAGFSVRILAHALGSLSSGESAHAWPRAWVHGVTDLAAATALVDAPLRRVLRPAGPAFVHAGPELVPMTLLEAMGRLVDRPAVLVTFVQDAMAPHHEALAAAIILARQPTPRALNLYPPVLRRTSAYLGPLPKHAHPLASIARITTAINVGRPTIETTPSEEGHDDVHWRIELDTPD